MLHIILIGAMLSDSRPEPDRIEAEAAEPQRYTRARGNRYSKSIEVAPDGIYLSDHLEEVIEHCYKNLRDSANQSQMVASGWIAIPESLSLDEAHAARIFEAVGAWNQVKVAA
jgi:hypothetical protein